MSDKVPFRPLGANILGIKRVATERVGRLFVPEGAKEKLYEAEVVAVGPGHRKEDGEREPLDVSVGDIIMYGKYTGHDVRIDGREYIVMVESDVLGVIGGTT